MAGKRDGTERTMKAQRIGQGIGLAPTLDTATEKMMALPREERGLFA